MKCFIPGCITNDDIVSCTSVFFVSFPKTRSVQQQWYTVLEVTDREEREGFKAGRLKICSTHFPEDCFTTHPQYGYRFLQHSAIPSVFPAEQQSTVAQDEEQDELDGSQSDEQEQRSDEEKEELQLVAQTEDEAEIAIASEEPAEEFGVQYVNGQYIILKLVNQPSDQQNAPSLEEIPNDHTGEEEAKKEEATLLDECTEGNADIIEEPPPDQETVQEVYMEDGLAEEGEYKQVEECLEDEKSDQVVRIECTMVENSPEDTTDGEPQHITNEQEEKVIILEQEEPADGTNGSNETFEVVSNTYGAIEALDEMSVDGDQVKVSQNRYKNRAFTEFCQYCSKGFYFKSALQRHEVVHTGAKPFVCDICNRSFSQKTNLTCHMVIHSGKPRIKPHVCGQCDASFDRLSGLLMHQRIHQRRSPYECPICSTIETCSTTFYDHLKKLHKDQITIQECLDLMAHQGSALVYDEPHSPTRPDEMKLADGSFQCTGCEKVYKTMRRLNKHMRTMHPKIFSCVHCFQRFPYKSLLQKHMTVHTKEQAHPCSHCDAKYTQKSNLVSHMIRYHPDMLQPEMLKRRTTVTCPKCKMMSVRANFLQRHRCVVQSARKRKRSSTASASDQKYAERADGKMGTKGKELRQERFHTPIFECGTCRKTWRSSVALRNHRCPGRAALDERKAEETTESEQDIPSPSECHPKDQYDDEQFMEDEFAEIGVMVVDGYSLDGTEPTTVVLFTEESGSSH
ncbi:zinc finger protein 286A-like [Anopheles aquasalis]|uniref:zinc finger protein 286A-like n=1 Tax=Anopheles aquasalis TaxID=42839 RepID=UPI00215B6874|nr:zinc finger protein 286A-like [Anopheles aquasalis]